jgi:hypothetical protein
MGVVTIYRLAEQVFNLIEGGNPAAASSISFNELKIACGNVINLLLKTEYLQVNGAVGETIPNGSVLGLYEGISCVSYNNKSKAQLPVKPIKLPRNMGVWAIYPKYTTNGDYELDKEFVPMQMGQGALIKSQPIINNLLGQTGYEVFGDTIIFNRDIKMDYPDIQLAIRLVVMDISLYGDYDILPVLPEMEWEVIQQVFKLYSSQPLPDKLVDSTVKENANTPVNQQKQS